jgi:hypothetical protein
MMSAMKKLMLVFSALLLSVATCANAMTISSFCAYVISVDTPAKTVKLKYTNEVTPTNWKETAATWDKDTEWVQAEKRDLEAGTGHRLACEPAQE